MGNRWGKSGNSVRLYFLELQNHWAEDPAGLQSMGSLRVRHDLVTSLSLSLSCIGEGNGNPLQCSCLENPRDRGAWWAAVYGIAQSRTRLKWLSSLAYCSLGFPGGANGKESALRCRRCKEARVWSLDQEEPLEGGHDNPLQYSCLENLLDRGA